MMLSMYMICYEKNRVGKEKKRKIITLLIFSITILKLPFK
jgi:hypothetical protein